MRLAECETFVVANPPPGFGGQYFVFVKLVTDTGVVGYGEVYAPSFGPAVIERAVVDVFDRHLAGHEAHRIRLMWRRVYGSGYSLRADPTLLGVLSGLEMACWDIVGKDLGRPVHEVLGGKVRDRLRAYTYLYPSDGDRADVYADPDLAGERAAEAVAAGFTAVKFDPAGPYTVFDGHQPSLDDLRRSERITAAVRDAVGDRADLLIGTHGQFTASGAIRLARRLERFDPLWFEEPTQPIAVDDMALVARSTTIPIATGERLTTAEEFARLLHARAASIVQPNLGRCGGLTTALEIAAIARANDASVAPHLYNGPIIGAANIQLAALVPNFLLLEGIGDWSGIHGDLVRGGITFDEGHVVVPDAPGLGVELDEAVARSHPFRDGGGPDDLHLRMTPDPVR